MESGDLDFWFLFTETKNSEYSLDIGQGCAAIISLHKHILIDSDPKIITLIVFKNDQHFSFGFGG